MREYNYSFLSRTHWLDDVSILASTHKPEDIRGCEGARIQASTHKPEDMRMQGYRQGISTWRYEDVRMRGYKQVHRNLRIWRCEDARIKTSQIYQTCRLLLDFTPVYIPNDSVYISRHVYISNGIYLIIFWCTIHQTLPKYSQELFYKKSLLELKVVYSGSFKF